MRPTKCIFPTIFYVLFLIQYSYPQIWADRWPSPTASSLASGSYGNDKFLLIGDQGTLLQSYNGTTWDTCYSPTDGLVHFTSPSPCLSLKFIFIL